MSTKRRTDPNSSRWTYFNADIPGYLGRKAKAVHQRTTQVYCTFCDPMHYVRKPEWPAHRTWAQAEARNRSAAVKAAARAGAAAGRAADQAAARPVNHTKRHGGPPVRENKQQRQESQTALEAIMQGFRAQLARPPGSLPAEKATAEQMAELFTAIADQYRRLVEVRFEQGMAAEVLEPYMQMSRSLSRISDLHMEVYGNAHRRYGQLAEELGRKDVPTEYVAAGNR